MQTIKNQTLGGTRVDSQGERNPKEVLESFAEQYAGKRMPLNQQHLRIENNDGSLDGPV